MTGASNMITMIIGIFFGSVVGFLMCLGIMFWMGIIGLRIREFLNESVDELIVEFKGLVYRK
nr:MAG TPA: Protein of unknown function (DUF3789) [Caudoviricetes sp.]